MNKQDSVRVDAVSKYNSIDTWSKSLARQWGGDPLAEDPTKLESLIRFCEFMAKDPDELLNYCFLRRRATGERFPSKKRREEITARVREFVTANGLKGTEARRQRSHIFSFLSHNGVLI